MIKKHRIRLLGKEARGRRIAWSTLRDLLEVVGEGCARALRLRIEGRSQAKGQPPAWLKDAVELDFVGLEEGSTVLCFESRSLREASPSRFTQSDLFPAVDADADCFELMLESLRDLVSGNEESELYDDDLVATFQDLEKVTDDRYETIELGDGRSVLHIEAKGFQRIRELRRRTPVSHRARVSGMLDAIRHSDRMFTLVLESNRTIRGVAETVSPASLSRLWGKQVVISGRAVYRPSGALLRMDADLVEPATDADLIWSQEPRPLEEAVESSRLHVAQGAKSGISGFFGQWPGAESDEELSRALKELS